MKQKQLILIFIFILQSTPIVSQVNRNAVYFDFIQIIGLYDTSLDLGYIRKTDSKFDYEFLVGVILPWDNSRNKKIEIGREKAKGFEIGVSPRLKYEKFYLGLLNRYAFHKYKSNRFKTNNDFSKIQYNVDQHIISNYLVIGFPTLNSKSIYSDVTISIGIRHIYAKNDSLIPVRELSQLHRLSPWLERESNGWHHILGIKLSYPVGLIF